MLYIYYHSTADPSDNHNKELSNSKSDLRNMSNIYNHSNMNLEDSKCIDFRSNSFPMDTHMIESTHSIYDHHHKIHTLNLTSIDLKDICKSSSADTSIDQLDKLDTMNHSSIDLKDKYKLNHSNTDHQHRFEYKLNRSKFNLEDTEEDSED